jgi:hypothetical protein
MRQTFAAQAREEDRQCAAEGEGGYALLGGGSTRFDDGWTAAAVLRRSGIGLFTPRYCQARASRQDRRAVRGGSPASESGPNS